MGSSLLLLQALAIDLQSIFKELEQALLEMVLHHLELDQIFATFLELLVSLINLLFNRLEFLKKLLNLDLKQLEKEFYQLHNSF